MEEVGYCDDFMCNADETGLYWESFLKFLWLRDGKPKPLTIRWAKTEWTCWLERIQVDAINFHCIWSANKKNRAFKYLINLPVVLWALLPCGHYYCVGITTVWALLLCGHCYSVGIATVWALLQCGHCYCVGITTVWALLLCGHCYCVGIATVWALLPCGHCYRVGIATVWALLFFYFRFRTAG